MKYPFKTGETYFLFKPEEGLVIIEYRWCKKSEAFHRKHPNTVYYKTLGEAKTARTQHLLGITTFHV